MRAPSTQLKLAVWVGLLLVLNATVGASLHFALVQHAICAEHGETVHVDGDALGEALAHHHQPGFSDGDEPGADKSHEHCAVIMVSREEAVLTEVSVPLAPVDHDPYAVLGRLPDATSPRGPPLVLLAPKTSPPSHA